MRSIAVRSFINREQGKIARHWELKKTVNEKVKYNQIKSTNLFDVTKGVKMSRSNRLKFFINIVEFCKGGSQSLHSLRRRLWAKERTSAREGDTKRCLLLVRPFFLVPTTSKRLLRRLSLQDVSL